MKKERIIRDQLKAVPLFKVGVISLRALRNKYGFFTKINFLLDFFADYRAYKKLNTNDRFSLKTSDLYPRIYDKTSTTPVDHVYFYQDAWCAKKVFELKPAHHYDIGSEVGMIGIISQFTPTTMIDIRPLNLSISGLSFIKGSILNLPFKDGEISSLSSICVLEHIGLGRYGDPLDSFGSEKAFTEMIRVLSDGGSLYISVPIDDENRVYFNAHRAFTRDYVLELAKGLTLVEEQYIYGSNMQSAYDPKKGFGTGLYHFKK